MAVRLYTRLQLPSSARLASNAVCAGALRFICNSVSPTASRKAGAAAPLVCATIAEIVMFWRPRYFITAARRTLRLLRAVLGCRRPGDTIAAGGLGMIKRLIGLRQNLRHHLRRVLEHLTYAGDVTRRAMPGVTAERGGERHFAGAVGKRQPLDRTTHAFGGDQRARGIGLRQQQTHFFAADARGDVGTAQRAFQHAAHSLQHGGAEQMTVGIVDMLEEVEVHYQQRSRLAGAAVA